VLVRTEDDDGEAMLTAMTPLLEASATTGATPKDRRFQADDAKMGSWHHSARAEADSGGAGGAGGAGGLGAQQKKAGKAGKQKAGKKKAGKKGKTVTIDLTCSSKAGRKKPKLKLEAIDHEGLAQKKDGTRSVLVHKWLDTRRWFYEAVTGKLAVVCASEPVGGEVSWAGGSRSARGRVDVELNPTGAPVTAPKEATKLKATITQKDRAGFGAAMKDMARTVVGLGAREVETDPPAAEVWQPAEALPYSAAGGSDWRPRLAVREKQANVLSRCKAVRAWLEAWKAGLAMPLALRPFCPQTGKTLHLPRKQPDGTNVKFPRFCYDDGTPADCIRVGRNTSGAPVCGHAKLQQFWPTRTATLAQQETEEKARATKEKKQAAKEKKQKKSGVGGAAEKEAGPVGGAVKRKRAGGAGGAAAGGAAEEENTGKTKKSKKQQKKKKKRKRRNGTSSEEAQSSDCDWSGCDGSGDGGASGATERSPITLRQRTSGGR
jgi:hypothetical protein